MHQILISGDSLSWGIIPDTRSRFRFDQRWPGIVELELQKAGVSARVIEDCLNGRRTVWLRQLTMWQTSLTVIFSMQGQLPAPAASMVFTSMFAWLSKTQTK